jgi:tetratricopeptide (TPR) repeat protein
MADIDRSPMTIDRMLAELASIGLGCPPHMTLQRYLAVLDEGGLVSATSAENLLRLHQQTIYAGRDGNGKVTALANQVLDQIKERVGADASAVHRVAVRLHQRPSAIAPLPDESAASPVPERVELAPESRCTEEEPGAEETDAIQDDPEAPQPLTLRLPWAGPSRRTVVIALIVMIWSLAMVEVGSYGHEPIRYWIAAVRARIFRYPVPPQDIPGEIERARQRAGANHDSLFDWRHYANSARRFGYSTDAVVAYHHLIARRPDDAELLNSLAWLYCTADDLHARDPVQALALAERAYAISQTPGITDTLAEAAFQNGDTERAIALEEEALSRVGDQNQDFFRRQLEKFKRAAERSGG